MDLKEKILKDVGEKSNYVTYDDIVENVKEEIHEAMDELSKIVAIAFFKWTESNLDEDGMYYGGMVTDDDLFKQFTQSKEYKELMDGK